MSTVENRHSSSSLACLWFWWRTSSRFLWPQSQLDLCAQSIFWLRHIWTRGQQTALRTTTTSSYRRKTQRLNFSKINLIWNFLRYCYHYAHEIDQCLILSKTEFLRHTFDRTSWDLWDLTDMQTGYRWSTISTSLDLNDITKLAEKKQTAKCNFQAVSCFEVKFPITAWHVKTGFETSIIVIGL